MKNMLELYMKYNVNKDYTSIGLFREIQKKYNLSKVLYPWCYVHITPSLIFPYVTYVDSFRNTHKFYESQDVKEFIQEHKEYSQDSEFTFYQKDYTKDIPENIETFNVIISQYWWFVWQATKKYLKKWWILVCNNSHWDASMASFDSDYELVAIYNRVSDEKYRISENNLDKYLIPKDISKNKREIIEKNMRWIAYTKSPSGYIFRKIK